MKVGPFMPLKYVPVIPEGARAGQRTGGRPSWLDRGLQSSSVAVPDSPGFIPDHGQSVRYTRGYRVSRHRAVKRASSGDSLRLSRDLDEQLSDLRRRLRNSGFPNPRLPWSRRSAAFFGICDRDLSQMFGVPHARWRGGGGCPWDASRWHLHQHQG